MGLGNGELPSLMGRGLDGPHSFSAWAVVLDPIKSTKLMGKVPTGPNTVILGNLHLVMEDRVRAR